MKPKIVLVEDNQMMNEYMSRYLSDKFEVKSYYRVSEAINGLNLGERPDLIITDYEVKEDTGLNMIQSLKNMKLNIPTVVVSGHKDVNVKLQCFKEGAFDFVQKPFNPKELEARLLRMLAIASPFTDQITFG